MPVGALVGALTDFDDLARFFADLLDVPACLLLLDFPVIGGRGSEVCPCGNVVDAASLGEGYRGSSGTGREGRIDLPDLDEDDE